MPCVLPCKNSVQLYLETPGILRSTQILCHQQVDVRRWFPATMSQDVCTESKYCSICLALHLQALFHCLHTDSKLDVPFFQPKVINSLTPLTTRFSCVLFICHPGHSCCSSSSVNGISEMRPDKALPSVKLLPSICS